MGLRAVGAGRDEVEVLGDKWFSEVFDGFVAVCVVVVVDDMFLQYLVYFGHI